MSSPNTRPLAALGASALLITTLSTGALADGAVTVRLNGNTLSLNPAPTERAGRVFVPLRGVFENLGASVVYAGGVINATGRGHTVSLKIGSQEATVDGQPQTVDVAPFIIGASTYVPLRFVSQALGATVNYDGTNHLVALSTNGAATAQNPNMVITPAPGGGGANNGGAITLSSTIPARGANVSSRRPAIEALFGGGTVDPNTIKVYVDQADVTGDSTRSPRGFSYAPRSPLQAGEHRVRVTGTDANGQPFARGWAFTSGTSEAIGEITNVRPAEGASVGTQFIVSGRTSPNAHVTVQVGVSTTGGSQSIGGIIGAILGANGGGQQNSASYSLTADANGAFETQVSIGAPAESRLLLVINATDTRTGATATPVQEQLIIH